MKRTAVATWKGCIRRGEGNISTGSGGLNKLLFVTGTNDGELPSTTATELLAASVASCMAVSVARELEYAKIAYEKIDTASEITVSIEGKEPEIRSITVNIDVHTEERKKTAIDHAVQKARQLGVVTKLLKPEVKVNLKLSIAETEKV